MPSVKTIVSQHQVRLVLPAVLCRSRLLLLLGGALVRGLVLLVYTLHAQAQTGPLLTLAELLALAQDHNPTIASARLEARASEQDLAAAERLRWPTMTVSAESNAGNTRSAPNSVFQVEQTLWDFGQISARIAGGQSQVSLSQTRLHLQQQDIALQIIAAWQSLLSATERIKAADNTLKTLHGFVGQMQRRVQAQASAPIDLELVSARVLQTEVERAAAQNAAKLAISRLKQLTGQNNWNPSLPKSEHNSAMPGWPAIVRFYQQLPRLDLDTLVQNSPVVLKARLDAERAQHDWELSKAQNYPTIYARASKPLSESAVGAGQSTSTVAFIGLKYSPGAGFVSAAQTQAMATRIASAQSLVDTARLDTLQTLQSDRDEFQTGYTRTSALQKSVQSSSAVLESYRRQFEGNRKTWLDLMNAVRELTQNDYALVDAQAATLGAMWRLQIRAGQPIE
jgi:outer membrane protein, adhesin transport system